MCFSSFPISPTSLIFFFPAVAKRHIPTCWNTRCRLSGSVGRSSSSKTSQWMHGSKHDQRIGARKNIRKWVNIIWLEYFLSTFYTWRKHLKMKIHTCGKIGRFYCSNKYALWYCEMKKNPFLPQLIQSCEKGYVFPFFFKTDRLFFLATYGSNFHMRE